jgi:nucleoside-diphosphate-sugar epimerase
VSRVLITGGAGFIGAHAARRLVAEGAAVDLVDDFSRGVRDADLATLAASDRVRILQRDLRVRGALDDVGDGYSHVLHLAAVVGVGHVLRQPFAVLADSVAMLEGVIAAARRQPALERLVFMSTSEVYAGTLDLGELPFPTPESVPLAITRLAEPRTAYMLAKLYGEAMCRHADVPVSILRPHNVYGPRMGLSHVIPELLQRAHAADAGTELSVASIDHRRTFCHVDDAVELLWRVATTPACAGETLNLGRGEPEVSMGELGGLIAETVGKRLAVVPRPTTPGSPPRRCPDMSRMHSLVGRPPGVDLPTGVRRTYEWYRRHVFEAGTAMPTAV